MRSMNATKLGCSGKSFAMLSIVEVNVTTRPSPSGVSISSGEPSLTFRDHLRRILDFHAN